MQQWDTLSLEQEQITFNKLALAPNEGGQLKALESRARIKLLSGGERGGKSWTAAAILTSRAAVGKLFWLVGPDYEQARAEFLYALDNFQLLGAIRSKRDVSMPKTGPWEMLLKGGIVIRTRSSEDVKKLSAVAPDGVVMCEAAQHTYRTFLRLRGRVAETRGWMVLAGTFEESEDWYADLWKEFQSPNNMGGASFALPMYENTKVFPLGKKDPEVIAVTEAYSKVPGMVEERIEGIPVIPADRFFRAFRRSVHMGEHPFNPGRPVYIAVDPSEGVAPYCVAALQYDAPIDDTKERRPWDPIPNVCVIDIIYNPMLDEDAVKEAQRRPWWDNVHGGSIDVEEPDSRARWRALGRVNLRAKKWPISQGIKRLQSFISTGEEGLDPPHLFIDEGVPEEAVAEISKYKRRTEYSERPHLQCSDHFLKAVWYELLNRFGPVKATVREGVFVPQHRRM